MPVGGAAVASTVAAAPAVAVEEKKGVFLNYFQIAFIIFNSFLYQIGVTKVKWCASQSQLHLMILS